MIIIIPEPEWFYSYQDEKHFFDWLKDIPAVSSFSPEQDGLHVTIDTPVDDDSLADLLALCERYSLKMTALAVLCHSGNEQWFRNRDKYWYVKVFNS